jgi:hypothetical protein
MGHFGSTTVTRVRAEASRTCQPMQLSHCTALHDFAFATHGY